MKVSISSDVTAEVKGYCASGALDGISSALDVLDLYCSAAEDKVVPTIVESTSETSDPPETGTSSASVATETGTPNDNDNSAGGANKTAIIAGAVVGGVIALALLLGLGIFIRRKQKKPKNKSPPKISAPHEYNGMPELIGSHGNDSTTEIIKAAFPAPTTPESDYYPGRPELGGSKGVVTELPSGMYKPYRPPELQGDIAATQMPSASPIPKMPSPGTLAEMDAEEVPHMNKELPPSPMLSKYNKTCGRNSPATVCDSNIPAPLSSMNTGGSNASRWRQQEPVSEVFEMEANPVHKG